MAIPLRFNTLVAIYQESLRTYPGNRLFGVKRGSAWQWTTYAEFGVAVEGLRGGLHSLGVSRGDHIAIISDNRPEWAAAAFASYGLGAAIVPMYRAQNVKDWEYIVRDSEAKVLFVANESILEKTKPFLDSIPTLKHIVCIDPVSKSELLEGPSTHAYASLALATSNVPPPVQPEPDDVAGLIYTSGTTGNPKGVMLTHVNFASNVSGVQYFFSIQSTDLSLSFLPWTHVFGQTVELYCLFARGGAIAVAESVDKIIENLAEIKPTLLFSVPTIFNRIYMAVQKTIAEQPKFIQAAVQKVVDIAKRERQAIRSALTIKEHLLIAMVDKLVFAKVRARFGGNLSYAFSGGAAINQNVAEFIDTIGVIVYEGYGLTETSPIITGNCPGGRRFGSVGRALPGVRVEIDSTNFSDRRKESDGVEYEEGEVVAYGPNVMKGYYRLPKESAAVFTSGGGFRTGDMGYLDANGFLFITGRIKEQYKLENGRYVVPTPLEETLKLSPLIANVMVHGDNRPYNIAVIVANVEAVRARLGTSIGGTLTKETLKDPKVRSLFNEELTKLSSGFKHFEQVRDFILLDQDFTTDNGMLTPSLKLKRRAVMSAYGDEIEALYRKNTAAKPAAERVSSST